MEDDRRKNEGDTPATVEGKVKVSALSAVRCRKVLATSSQLGPTLCLGQWP